MVWHGEGLDALDKIEMRSLIRVKKSLQTRRNVFHSGNEFHKKFRDGNLRHFRFLAACHNRVYFEQHKAFSALATVMQYKRVIGGPHDPSRIYFALSGHSRADRGGRHCRNGDAVGLSDSLGDGVGTNAETRMGTKMGVRSARGRSREFVQSFASEWRRCRRRASGDGENLAQDGGGKLGMSDRDRP